MSLRGTGTAVLLVPVDRLSMCTRPALTPARAAQYCIVDSTPFSSVIGVSAARVLIYSLIRGRRC